MVISVVSIISVIGHLSGCNEALISHRSSRWLRQGCGLTLVISVAADVAADVATGEAMGEAVGEAVTAGETQFCMRSHDPWISSTIAYMIAQGYTALPQ